MARGIFALLIARQAAMSVFDRGAAVPQSALAGVFRPFYRAAGARSRYTAGRLWRPIPFGVS
jgi:signal transduction histidine kinase